MSTSVPPRRLPQEPGFYDLVAPDIHEIVSYLTDLKIMVSSFDYLVDVWGPSYCMPTMLIWRDYEYAQDLITPCVVQFEEGGLAPVLVFGPFLDVEAQQHFRNLYVDEGLPEFDEKDTTSLMISPMK
jgi:hypothetical protein